ncbi:MAG: class I adenylate-forming enzyme family protein [Polyangiaceae bacterium]
MGSGDPRNLTARFLRGDDAHTALIVRDRAVSYVELRSLVSAHEAELSAQGVEPGALVPIDSKETLHTLVSVLGTWQRGAIAVPLDPGLAPPQRARLLARLGEGAATGQSSLAGAALLLFTSGSSGEPKGVLLGASGIAKNVAAILDYLPVASAERIGLCAPLFYSYGLLGQAMTTLAASATLVCLLSEPSSEAQVARARTTGVRGLSSVPTHLRKLAFYLAEKGETLPLSFCAIAGANLDESTRALLSERFGPCTFFHQYGLTEASPRVTAIASTNSRFAAGSVGKPLPGIELRIRDEARRTLSPREEGDVHVHSPSVMLGYYGDEEATRNAIDAEGFLRTGDRGFLDEEGYLYLSGRSDGVVKCGGERVGLESVATTLRGLTGVKEAAVVAVPHAELGHALVAFVEPEMPVGPLRSRLRELLSPAQRPSRVIAMPMLPRTSNGKLALAQMRALAEGV